MQIYNLLPYRQLRNNQYGFTIYCRTGSLETINEDLEFTAAQAAWKMKRPRNPGLSHFLGLSILYLLRTFQILLLDCMALSL